MALDKIAIGRRSFLVSTISLVAVGAAHAAHMTFAGGHMPWLPDQTRMPTQVLPGPWTYFTAEEGVAIGALSERLVPADDLSPSGKEVGVPIYIDRQLSGNFGSASNLYMSPPFANGLPGQGPQGSITPAVLYRRSLAALDNYCRSAYLGEVFADLRPADQDKILTAMNAGTLPLEGVNAKAFFQVMWQNVKEGFFADPVYGGNRNMAGWRMIGFPGARYDYRGWIDKHNQAFPLPPVGIADHPDWAQPVKS